MRFAVCKATVLGLLLPVTLADHRTLAVQEQV